jgi:DNA polymerase-1
MKKTEENIYLLIDSHALLHRAYHAMPFLTNKQGVPSGALFGLTNMLLQAIEKFKPDYVFAANDLPGETFRGAAFEHYKANRKDTEEKLVEQIILMPKVFEAFHIPLLSKEGYEADDVIGTLTKKIQKEDKSAKIIIFTGDMDIMQLVNDKVFVYTGKKGEEDILYGESEILAKYGLTPGQIPDFKGLRGDASDNIPGIKGVGEKTATQILSKGENIEKIYELIKEGKDRTFFGISERFFELLKNGEDEALFSKELATIGTNISIEVPEQAFDLEKAKKDLLNLCEEYNFTSVKRKLTGVVTLKEGDLNDFVKLDHENISNKEDNKREETLDEKVDISFSKEGLQKAKIALWVLNSQEGDADVSRLIHLTKKKNEEQVLEYLEAELKKNGLYKVYEEIELPLIPVLEEANKVGIMLNREKLSKLLKKYEEDREKTEKAIFSLSGKNFNLNSPKQLGEILFNELKIQDVKDDEGKLKKLKKTGGGKLSTRAEVLEEMKENHPIVPLVLDFREKDKMINTYLEPLLTYSQFDERIHTTFVQTGAQTGRFSSVNPNMQNIPVRGDEGVELRKCFVASPKKVLLAADYSQIELRIAAMLSGEEYLRDIFLKGGDIHKSVAVKMFKKEPAEITKDERNAAKAMNFGIIYGMGVNSIKNTLKVERNVAQAFYDSYTMVSQKVSILRTLNLY